jgi:hypothetical protein
MVSTATVEHAARPVPAHHQRHCRPSALMMALVTWGEAASARVERCQAQDDGEHVPER